MSSYIASRPGLVALMVGCQLFLSSGAIAASSDPDAAIRQQQQKSNAPKSLSGEPKLPPIPENIPPDEAKQVTFQLEKLIVETVNLNKPNEADPNGSRVYDLGKEFEPIIREHFGKDNYIGVKASILDIYQIADKITAHYRNDGYFLSRAVVPDQTIEHGIVRIRVVEGYIDKILIQSDEKASQKTLREHISLQGDLGHRTDLFKKFAEKIRAYQPINIEDLERDSLLDKLERYTLLINDLPGVSATSKLSASKDKTGATDLVLVLSEKPFDASVSYDNRGTKTAGPRQVTVTLGANNLFGLYEKTTLTYVQTTQAKELKYFALSHEETLNSEGTKLTFSGNKSWAEPGAYLTYLEMNSQSESIEINLTHPAIRRRQVNLSLHARLTYKNSKSKSLGELSSQDKIRALRVGATYDYADKWSGISLVSAELHQGLDVLNATEKGAAFATRSLGRSDFTKLTLDLYRNQRLPHGFGMMTAASGQWSAHELLSSEEFGYGGSQFGRAYDSSEISGDQGFSAKLEVQYYDPPTIPNTKYHLYSFYDFGATYNITPLNQPWRETGASAGGGLRFTIADKYSGSLELAKPLTRPVSSRGDNGNAPRLFFRLAASF